MIYMNENGALFDTDMIREEYEIAVDECSYKDTFESYLDQVTTAGGYYTPCTIKLMTCCDIVDLIGDSQIHSVCDIIDSYTDLHLLDLYDMQFIANEDDYELIQITDFANYFTNY